MRQKLVLLFLIPIAILTGQSPSNEPIVCPSLEEKCPPQEQTSAEAIEQKFGYFSIGLGPFPIPLPAISGGFRGQWGHHGVDTSLQVQTIVALTSLKTRLLYQHYFKPSLCSEFYVGGGAGVATVLGNDGRLLSWHGRNLLVLSPEFTFGKQYRNESNDLRFFEMQLSFPSVAFGKRNPQTLWFPLVIFNYGIGF